MSDSFNKSIEFMCETNRPTQPWKSDPAVGNIPTAFAFIQAEFFQPIGEIISSAKRENESSEYGAIQFDLKGRKALFRQAKHTPRKVGQFVTLWKRESADSEIAPFDITDNIELVFILTDDGERFGLFVFNRALLARQGIFSAEYKDGKRGFRVYGPWTAPTAAQAKRSQKWQCEHFVELTHQGIGQEHLTQFLA